MYLISRNFFLYLWYIVLKLFIPSCATNAPRVLQCGSCMIRDDNKSCNLVTKYEFRVLGWVIPQQIYTVHNDSNMWLLQELQEYDNLYSDMLNFGEFTHVINCKSCNLGGSLERVCMQIYLDILIACTLNKHSVDPFTHKISYSSFQCDYISTQLLKVITACICKPIDVAGMGTYARRNNRPRRLHNGQCPYLRYDKYTHQMYVCVRADMCVLYYIILLFVCYWTYSYSTFKVTQIHQCICRVTYYVILQFITFLRSITNNELEFTMV